MKISVISTEQNIWEATQIQQEAKKQGFSCEIKDIVPSIDLKKQGQSLGEIVFWRSSSLKMKNRKALSALFQDRVVIGFSLDKLFIANKFFQQYQLRTKTDIIGIDTFRFSSREKLLDALKKHRQLVFPFIQKPQVGTQGKGIRLIRTSHDLDDANVSSYVYQNYIENDGDFRVLVLGGKVLGCIKRVAAKGNFLNNISQGGTAVLINDPVQTAQLSAIALKVAHFFTMTFCAVDIIYDAHAQQYRFLELNTVPQWQAFQSVTGVNVAKELINTCVSLHDRKTKPIALLVKKNYLQSEPFLDRDKMFHFHLSMFFSKKGQLYFKKTAKDKKIYIDNLRHLEEIIAKNYFDLSLDHKLEFLVCAKLLNFKTYLDPIITQEALHSLSPHGNYLIDTLNMNKKSFDPGMDYAEHLSVLFILSQTQYK